MVSNPVSVVSIEDHEIYAAGLELLLEQSDIVELKANSGCLEEIEPLIAAYRPDVLLLDIYVHSSENRSLVSSLPIIPKLLKTNPHLKVVILSADKSPETVNESFEQGASAFILKDDAVRSNLPSIIVRAYRGHHYISPKASAVLNEFESKYLQLGLRPQHIRLMQLSRNFPDFTDIQLAEALGISPGTIRNQRSEICRIMETRSFYAAILQGRGFENYQETQKSKIDLKIKSHKVDSL